MPAKWYVLCSLLALVPGLNAQGAPDLKNPVAACGNDSVKFDVSRGSENESLITPAAGKAVVYFIELYDLNDKGRFNRPTIRHGVDGAWVGATQGFTYVTSSITPGQHHLCSRWQSHFGRLSDQVSLFNFEAEPGKRYFFRVQIDVEGASAGSVVGIDLQPVSEDEGVFLVSQAAPAVSKPK